MSEFDEQHGVARSRTLSRTTAFTDAAVAIALTLLILPLVDVAGAAGDTPVGTLLDESESQIFGFLLSFAVIIRYWSAHRSSWEGLRDYDEVLMGLNSLWLLTIIFLPFSTALLTSGDGLSRGGAVFYIATLLAIGLTGQAMAWRIYRRPALRAPFVTDAMMRGRLRQGNASLVVLLPSTALAVINPTAGLFALLLLAATRIRLRSHRHVA